MAFLQFSHTRTHNHDDQCDANIVIPDMRDYVNLGDNKAGWGNNEEECRE